MQITINQRMELLEEQEINLAQIIVRLYPAIPVCISLHNQKMIPADKRQDINLQDGDEVEIIPLVSGG